MPTGDLIKRVSKGPFSPGAVCKVVRAMITHRMSNKLPLSLILTDSHLKTPTLLPVNFFQAYVVVYIYLNTWRGHCSYLCG